MHFFNIASGRQTYQFSWICFISLSSSLSYCLLLQLKIERKEIKKKGQKVLKACDWFLGFRMTKLLHVQKFKIITTQMFSMHFGYRVCHLFAQFLLLVENSYQRTTRSFRTFKGVEDVDRDGPYPSPLPIFEKPS